MKRCKRCGEKFTPSKFTPFQIHCSDQCRRQHFRQTHKDWLRRYRREYYRKYKK